MHIPEIIEVQETLDKLKSNNLIESWELPYANLLTRRSAAIFFISSADNSESKLGSIWKELENFTHFSFRKNEEKELSNMEYRITFNEEEKAANAAASPVK